MSRVTLLKKSAVIFNELLRNPTSIPKSNIAVVSHFISVLTAANEAPFTIVFPKLYLGETVTDDKY